MAFYKHPNTTLTEERETPLYRRYIHVTKNRGEDFGCSLCRLEGRIYLTDVVPGTCAWRLGLRRGDRLDELNDLTLTGPISAWQVRELLLDADELELTVTDTPLIKTYVLDKKDGAQLGVLYMQGSISELFPATVSAKAKMRNGDSIIAVNGKDTTGLSDAYVMLQLNLRFSFEGRVEVVCAPKALISEFEQARVAREGHSRRHHESIALT